jgi:hypothetical protein
MGLETLFFTGAFITASLNHLVWTMPPSAQELENEKYWEMKVKAWKIQKKNDERFKSAD